MLSVFPPNGFVYGQVDPGSPGAWRKEPYFAGLKTLARTLLDQRRHVIMFVGDEATLVMPDGAIPIGRMTSADQFRIEPAFGPEGPDLAGDEGLTMTATDRRPEKPAVKILVVGATGYIGSATARRASARTATP